MCPKNSWGPSRIVWCWKSELPAIELFTGGKNRWSPAEKDNPEYMKCFSPNSVNIHFHMLWLATQAWDIHWISTGLQNTMHACMSNSISSCQFWQDKINVFVAGFLLVRYILLNNYSPQCWWIMLDIYLTIHFHFLNNWFAKQNGCAQVFLSL